MPAPQPADPKALRAFWTVLERVRDDLDAAVREAAESVPSFEAILREQDPAETERQSARSRELERQALVEGRWEAYLAHLRTQGATYAHLGVPIGDWFALLSPYREVVLDEVLAADEAVARDALTGLGQFLDIAMATIAESYTRTQTDLVRKAQRDLARHARQLERTNRELDEFAYVASHDLKAPLRDIQTLAEWVFEDSFDSLGAESRRHLELIRDRMARMERLLEDLLAYSRAGRVLDAVDAFDVSQAISAAASVVLPSGERGVPVRGADPRIISPRAPLELVLRNLLGNAVKHHDGDGSPTVEVEVDERDDEIEIAVSDDGPGIPEEFHDRVFRMFQTLRPRDEVEASGMGLAVVKKTVEAQGGSVSLESTPGEGTTVRFTWPKSPRKDPNERSSFTG